VSTRDRFFSAVYVKKQMQGFCTTVCDDLQDTSCLLNIQWNDFILELSVNGYNSAFQNLGRLQDMEKITIEN